MHLKSEFALKIFTALNIPFTFRSFEQLCAFPEKRSYPKIFHCIEIFLSFRIFEQLALALKTELALKFFKPWGRQLPPLPRLVRLCLFLSIKLKIKNISRP